MIMQRVLIIDDEFDLCLLLKLHLVSKHYEVEMAYNLKDGLKKIESFNPDFLFLDNNLPDGHGWEKAKEIINHHPSIYINLMSGDGESLYNMLPDEKNICIMEKPLSKKAIDKCLLSFPST